MFGSGEWSPRRRRRARALAAAGAEEREWRDEQSEDGSYRPGGEVAMTLLFPNPCPRMRPEQAQRHPVLGRCVAVALRRFGGVELDGTEVFGADEAVLVGTHESGGCAMVTVERAAIEMIGNEHVVCQGVFDRHDRAVAVETDKDDVCDGRARLKGLDHGAIEGLERDALPVQVGGGPPGHAVKVGGEFSAGKCRELG